MDKKDKPSKASDFKHDKFNTSTKIWKNGTPKKQIKQPNIISFLKPYLKWIFGLFIISLASSSGNLIIPRITGQALDLFQQNNLGQSNIILFQIGAIAVMIFILTILQSYLVSFLSERVAADVRLKMAKKLSVQTNQFITTQTTGKILTNYTSDVKTLSELVSQGVVSTFAAVLILFGSIFSLISINLYLALWVLSIVPLIVITFAIIFRTIGKLFKESQANLDQINRIINESIVAAGLVRALNSQKSEIKKFNQVNLVSKELNLKIVHSFAALIPTVSFLSNMAVLAVVWFGGNLVIQQELTLGSLSAFVSYISLLITPIFLLGFISSTASRAVVSLKRINEITESEVEYSSLKNTDENANHEANNNVNKNYKDVTKKEGNEQNYEAKLKGKIQFKNVNLEIQKRSILRNINLDFEPGQKIAILGPTGSGKTQLMYLLTALQKTTSGQILIDDVDISKWSPASLYAQMGLVFQDSLIFTTTLRENISLSTNLTETQLQTVISTAQLQDLVASQISGLDTEISERGSNLSGGQKQRLMLARALAINPTILLLDDFTARVDLATEKSIQQSLKTNYPNLTLINITQKIEPVKDYDQIILIMEGEIIATGRHKELLKKSLEYKQIWDSQQSTEE